MRSVIFFISHYTTPELFSFFTTVFLVLWLEIFFSGQTSLSNEISFISFIIVSMVFLFIGVFLYHLRLKRAYQLRKDHSFCFRSVGFPVFLFTKTFFQCFVLFSVYISLITYSTSTTRRHCLETRRHCRKTIAKQFSLPLPSDLRFKVILLSIAGKLRKNAPCLG